MVNQRKLSLDIAEAKGKYRQLLKKRARRAARREGKVEVIA